MESVFVGLISMAIALGIQRAFLSSHKRRLRASEQAYRFHALRDDLQLLAAGKFISVASPVFEFLMFTLNMAIRNAGAIRLREVLQLSKLIDKEVERHQFEKLLAEIQDCDPRVQQLAGRTFFSFAHMLIANDWLVASGLAIRQRINRGWGKLSAAINWIDRLMIAFLLRMASEKVQAVDRASHYRDMGQRVNPC